VDPYRAAEPHRLPCPSCQQPTDSLKSSTMFSIFLFLWIGAWWKMKRVIACPGCLRRELVLSTLLNTLLANLLSPIVWLWHGFLFLRSFSPGHAPEVLALAQAAQPRPGGWVCRSCGQRGDTSGNCPRCWVPMVEA
jgi:hypothetical protein